ncbi:MAG TPA: hypothetical protein DD384_03945 [Firmicutes bacterium]|nr:hypothetical protein [Bacillota bacterium]
MKRDFIFLLTLISLLPSCGSGREETSSTSQEGLLTSEASSKEDSTSSKEELHIPVEMVGTWYITSSQMGVLPVNGIFEISGDDTLLIGERTLSLNGNYAGYEEAYEFVYKSIHFIVSYDAEKNGIDWGYQNGENQDFGFAESEPLSNSYDYEGEEYPMNQIKEYLSTTLDVPAMAASSYKLKLYESSLYSAKCAALEISTTTLEDTIGYVAALVNEGYTFSKNGEEIKDDVFTAGYDANKVYSLRIIYFPDEKETNVFFYNYNAKIVS